MKSTKCSACGFVGWANAEYCKKCRLPLMLHSLDGSDHSPMDYGNNRFVDHEHNQHWDHPPRGEPRQGLAIASLVVGIVSFLTLSLLGVAALTGIILGLVALAKTNRYPSKLVEKGWPLPDLS